MQYDAMIIGGGASGLIAAGARARRGRRAVLLEKQARVGRKLLSTGNGRCNLTNLRAGTGDYHGSRKAVQAALRAWPPEKVMAVAAVGNLESAASRIADEIVRGGAPDNYSFVLVGV